jgi:dienelactone hydrolase
MKPFKLNTMDYIHTFFSVLLVACSTFASAQSPIGSVQDGAWIHSAESLKAVAQHAQIALPAKVTGKDIFTGLLKNAPATSGAKVPVIVFMHGSSGLSLPAIAQWQLWLAKQGYASIAPDSFALAGRLTYKSPVDLVTYERVHDMRMAEIAPTVAALQSQPWADTQRLVLAGTSEGSVPVARHDGQGFAAKIMYAWSCEKNYFVTEAKSNFNVKKPVLNVISSVDPFFSKTNTWLGNDAALGHCGAALKGNAQASVVLIPDAPHTLFMMPAAQHATAGFLMQTFNQIFQ